MNTVLHVLCGAFFLSAGAFALWSIGCDLNKWRGRRG